MIDTPIAVLGLPARARFDDAMRRPTPDDSASIEAGLAFIVAGILGPPWARSAARRSPS